MDFPSYSYKKWTLINSCCCISVQSKSPGPSTNLKNKTFSKRVFDCLDFTKCLKRSIHIRGHNYLDFFIPGAARKSLHFNYILSCMNTTEMCNTAIEREFYGLSADDYENCQKLCYEA